MNVQTHPDTATEITLVDASASLVAEDPGRRMQ